MGCSDTATFCWRWTIVLRDGKSAGGDAADALAVTDMPRNNAQSYKKRKNTGSFSRKNTDFWVCRPTKGAGKRKNCQPSRVCQRIESVDSTVVEGLLGASGLSGLLGAPGSGKVALLSCGKGI